MAKISIFLLHDNFYALKLIVIAIKINQIKAPMKKPRVFSALLNNSFQTCYNQFLMSIINHTMRYLALILILTGCSQTPVIENIQHIETSQIKTLGFTLKTPSHGEYQISSAGTTTMATQISQRFAKAGYPIYLSGGDTIKNLTQHSHFLEAVVEDPRMTDTQVGVTLDFGGSNPRAANFQKTLSAPITCTLKSLNNNTPPISLKELKSIQTQLDTIHLTTTQKQQKLQHFYTENIGSTCHNLLKRLGITPKTRRQSGNSNTHSAAPEAEPFMPAIRIETKYIKRNKTAQPQKQEQHIGHSQQHTTTETPSDQHQSSEPPSIQTEPTEPSGDLFDKEVTIFNQGDTIILKFGYERK